MLGCYDFCGHYEWTFGWLERAGGRELVKEYWSEAINHDSQRHARELIEREGFAGMEKYWGHTLGDESPSREFDLTSRPDVFRIDLHNCPSKGFLLRNGLENFGDYCDHCMGWLGPMMKESGFTIDHEHNHRGQCWWEMRRPDPARVSLAPGAISAKHDVRLLDSWNPPAAKIDRYFQANDPDAKISRASAPDKP